MSVVGAPPSWIGHVAATPRGARGGSAGGQRQAVAQSRKARFTRRSSSE